MNTAMQAACRRCSSSNAQPGTLQHPHEARVHTSEQCPVQRYPYCSLQGCRPRPTFITVPSRDSAVSCGLGVP